MTRVVLAIWIYISSLAGALASGALISHILLAYPADHFRTFGSTIPAVSESYAKWLPYAPTILGYFALASLVTVGYFWRSSRPREVKTFAVALVSALNFCLSLFFVISLVVAYFLLPKVANGA